MVMMVLGIITFLSMRSSMPSESEIRSEVKIGIDLILRHDYSGAEAKFKEIAVRYPTHPAGSVYLSALVQMISMDYERMLDYSTWNLYQTNARTFSEEMIRKSPRSPWGYYYLGIVEGYEANVKVSRKEYISGVSSALNSIRNFEKAAVLDPELMDATVAIGVYQYWKSRKFQFLTWTPFFEDEREKGISNLRRATKSADTEKFTAYLSLINILNDADRHSEAESYAREALSYYPGNRFILWGLVRALRDGGKVAEAIRTYEKILVSIRKDIEPNPYNELVCLANILRLSAREARQGDFADHWKRVEELRKFKFESHLDRRVERQFRSLDEISKNYVR